jgi:hypothetical protein
LVLQSIKHHRIICVQAGFWLIGQFQPDPEHAADPDCTFNTDLARHQLNQALAYHQANTGALFYI